MQAVAWRTGKKAEMGEQDLLALGDASYRLAARVLRSGGEAGDIVQQAYFLAIRKLRSGWRPVRLRPWFLKVVANAAREHLRREANRRKGEAAMLQQVQKRSPGASDDLIRALREAMQSLEDKYRLPIALCCEEGLTQDEASEILDVPQQTLSRHLNEGLGLLRSMLAKAGWTAAPAAVMGALAHTAPPVPATLATAVEKIVGGKAAVAGPGASSAAAVAKGGIAMKAILGVVLAGTVAAGAAVLSSGFSVSGSGAGVQGSTRNSEPGTLNSAPPAVPAPINEHKGLQEREEVFEFAEKPKVAKEGDKVVITFASKGKCDATVTVVDKDGKIVRHLASGVLGKNAPYPFQQDSLSQKIVWDGLEDDFTKADAAGCKVRVSLGLKAKFERNIVYDPYDVGSYRVLLGKSKDGTMYVGGAGRNSIFVRAYDKDGKYLRTVIPYPAAEVGKAGTQFATTIWGDKTLVVGSGGPSGGSGWMISNLSETGKRVSFTASLAKYKEECKRTNKMSEIKDLLDTAEFMGKLPGVDGDVDIALRPAVLPPATKVDAGLEGKSGRLVADPIREEIYAGGESLVRLNGRTGEVDPVSKELRGSIFEHAMGLDGLLYLRIARGAALVRVDHDGKPVSFKKEYEFTPTKGQVQRPRLGGGPLSEVWCGGSGSTSWCFNRGMYVSSGGLIVTAADETTDEWNKLHGLKPKNHCFMVFDTDGKLLTADAVGEGNNGMGVTMDRDGSLYMVYGEKMPAGQDKLDGIADLPVNAKHWAGYGILVKYRGLGGKYPLNVGPGVKVGKGEELPGALWAYPLPGHKATSCACAHYRHDMDRWGRIWVPANQLYSVVVLDGNGNRMARFGRYGNVDDTEADLKAGKDGIRFVWPRALAASDTALYVSDFGGQRILKAALSYTAEETVPAP